MLGLAARQGVGFDTCGFSTLGCSSFFAVLPDDADRQRSAEHLFALQH
jgi:hypothetical protein